MGTCRRHFLQHVPMLDDLAVLIEAEDVDPRIVPAAGPGYSRAIVSKYSMKPAFPVATWGLCCTYSAPA